jgi:hypothetical protein
MTRRAQETAYRTQIFYLFPLPDLEREQISPVPGISTGLRCAPEIPRRPWNDGRQHRRRYPATSFPLRWPRKIAGPASVPVVGARAGVRSDHTGICTRKFLFPHPASVFCARFLIALVNSGNFQVALRASWTGRDACPATRPYDVFTERGKRPWGSDKRTSSSSVPSP